MKKLFKLLLVVLNTVFITGVFGQCLTDLERFLPEKNIEMFSFNTTSVSIQGDFLAIGFPASDSLIAGGGMVEVYKKDIAGWKIQAILTPSKISKNQGFGLQLKITNNNLYVIDKDSSLFIFNKNADLGWSSGKEDIHFTYDISELTSNNRKLEISNDESIIAIGDPGFNSNRGRVILFRKDVTKSWQVGPISLSYIASDENQVGLTFGLFYGSDIILKNNNQLAVGASGFNVNGTSRGAIYLYFLGNFYTDTPTNIEIVSDRVLDSFMKLSNGIGKSIVDTDTSLLSISTVYIENKYNENAIVSFSYINGVWSNIADTTYYYFQDLKIKKLTRVANKLFALGQKIDQTGYGVYQVILKDSVAATQIVEEYSSPWDALFYDFPLGVGNDENSLISCLWNNKSDSTANSILVINGLNSEPLNTTLSYFEPFNNLSSQDFNYGKSIHNEGEYIMVSAPKKHSRTRQSGVVDIYRYISTTWEKIYTIEPPIESYFENNFGSSVHANGNFLAIGSIAYRQTGAVFVYKKENTWETPKFYQELVLPELFNYYALGGDVYLEGDLLVATLVNKDPTMGIITTDKPVFGGSNAVAVFAFDGNLWKFENIINLTIPDNTFESSPIDIFNGKVILGDYMGKRVLVLEKEATSGWAVKNEFYIDFLSPSEIKFGFSLDMDENHLAVGAVSYNQDNIKETGAVFLFSKHPEEVWPVVNSNATKITSPIPEERGYFGSRVKLEGNILTVGSPGRKISYGTQLRDKPGAVYVYQGLTWDWSENIMLYKLEGFSRDQHDAFGFDLDFSKDNFFIGAPKESNPQSEFGGAFYVIPSPPIVKLEPDICTGDVPRKLFGYPNDGKWSGEGVTDPQAGIFDPSGLLPGFYELTYETDNCFYSGKMKIRVVTGPDKPTISSLQPGLCEGIQNELFTTIDDSNLFYQYFVKSSGDSDFKELATTDGKAIFDRIGYYFLEVRKEFCPLPSYSDTLYITPFQEDIEIETSYLICNNVDEVLLSSNKTTGHWSGTGIKDETIGALSRSLYNKESYIQYEYINEFGCVISDSSLISFTYHPKMAVNPELSYTVCYNTDTIQLKEYSNPGVLWSGQGISDPGGTLVLSSYYSEIDPVVTYSFENMYGCIQKDTLVFNVGYFPRESVSVSYNAETCGFAKEVELIPSQYSGKWTGYGILETGEKGIGIFQPEKFSDTPYHLKYEFTDRNGCVDFNEYDLSFFNSEIVLQTPSNVFTPNSDGYNEEFYIELENSAHFEMKIFNRLGKQVFESDEVSKHWSGENVSGGIYYYFFSYEQCDGVLVTKKGIVQVLK